MSQQDSDNVDKIFAHFDKDGSGLLEQDEAKEFITALFKSMGEEISAKHTEGAFNMLDSSGDGAVSKDELLDILKAAREY